MSDDGLHGNALVELAMFAGSFVGLAIVCDDHMVIALETLCVRWNVSLLVVTKRLGRVTHSTAESESVCARAYVQRLR